MQIQESIEIADLFQEFQKDKLIKKGFPSIFEYFNKINTN